MRMTITARRVAIHQQPRMVMLSTLLALFAGGLATGCPHPDEQFDEYVDNTKEQREEAMNTKLDMGGTLADVSGTHLFAIAPGFAADKQLQFIATASLTPEGEGGTLDLVLQPLRAERAGPVREPVGEPIELSGIAVDAGGGFTVDTGEVTVIGEANPISPADIVGTLTLSGSIQSADVFCGTVSGMLTQPAALPLDGSTFAAVRVADTSPDALPTDIVSACPAGGGDEGGGSGGTTTGSATGETGAQ